MGFSLNTPTLRSNVDWRLQASLQNQKNKLIGSSITGLLGGAKKLSSGLGKEANQEVGQIKQKNTDMAKRAILSADKDSIGQIAKELDNTQLLDRDKITNLLIKKADNLKQEDYKDQINEAKRVQNQFNIDRSSALLNNGIYKTIYDANVKQQTAPLDYQKKQLDIAQAVQRLNNPTQDVDKQEQKSISGLVKAFSSGYKDPQSKGLISAILTNAGAMYGQDGVIQVMNQLQGKDRDELQQYLIKMNGK
jgi:hypothetical protein